MNDVLMVMADPLPESFSVNKRLGQHMISIFQALVPNISIQQLDLYSQPPPFFDRQSFEHLWLNESKVEEVRQDFGAAQAPESVTYLQEQCALLNQFHHLIICAPIWNSYVPAILKAWIDLVISPNYTYEFSPEGIRPLHHLRSVTMVLSAGGDLSREHTEESVLRLIRATFQYCKIEDFHSVVVDRQEPSLYPNHEQIYQQAKAKSEALVREYFLSNLSC